LKLKIPLKNKTVFLIVFTLFSTLFFDLLVSSSSVMPFRLIYNTSFGLIMFVLAYTSILLVNGEEFSAKNFNFVFPRFSYIIPIVFNANAIFSIIWLNVPNIGFLSEDILTQGLNGLLPLVNFLTVMTTNAIVLYISVYGDTDIHLYKMAAYLIGVIAFETSLVIYAFHINGIEGVRWILCLFHITFIGLTFWLHRRFKTKEIRINLTCSDLLLALFSAGIFTMVYVPFGLYNLYADNAVVGGNILSIVKRVNLQPYYKADSYYTPIMGFVSILFAYITGFDNLLLSSNLPFLVGSLMFPFVTYHFLKSFITDDSRIAVIGAIIASLMDGLAVILLPVYAGKITSSIISWRISTATQSLYASNICQLWLTPYKSFSAVSAVAACSVLHKRQASSFMLSGAIFFMSFSNPRYSILTVLLLLLLFGIKKINMKGIVLFILSVTIFSGLTLSVHLYKQALALLTELYQRGFISEVIFNQFKTSLKSLVIYDASPFIILIVFIAFLGILVLTRLNFIEKTDNAVFTSQFSPRELPKIALRTSKTGKRTLVSSENFLLLGSMTVMLIYAVLHAYSLDTFLPFTKDIFNETLERIILRYHILIVSVAVGFLTLKCNRRTIFSSILVILLFYFGGILTRSTTLIPMVFVILAMPAFSSLVKYKRKVLVSSFLFFVFLGVFSATFYSATVTTPTRTDYADLPQVLNILLQKEPDTSVYSPSSYTYYANRVVKMAHLRLSSDPSCGLYIIDKDYIKAKLLESLVNNKNFTILYSGSKFILLGRQ